MHLDDVTDHVHELSAEYLSPADAAVLDVAERDGASSCPWPSSL